MYIKSRRNKKNRTGLYLAMTVIFLFCGTLTIHSFALNADCRELEKKRQELEAKKADLEKESQSIQEQQAYMQTDEYVEYIARQKFGLVYDNEIVFKAE